MTKNKIVVKYINVLTTKKFSPHTDFSLITSELSDNEAKIINQFKVLVDLKSKVCDIQFFYHKKFQWEQHEESVKQFNIYLKEFEKFVALMKQNEPQKYGIYITQAVRLLAKVKYENN